MTYNVTFIFMYGTLSITVETEATDEREIAHAASELFFYQNGFEPLSQCNDYGVETLDTAAGI